MKLLAYMVLPAILILAIGWLWYGSQQSSSPVQLDTLLWQEYKSKFIEQGRVIDIENERISHSEGQGYGMLMAVAADDKATFDELWGWTQTVLKRDDGLFAWRYSPCEYQDARCITDWNNATDGEILIAWALLKANRLWQDKAYLIAAQDIVALVLDKLVVEINGQAFFIPGQAGFEEAGQTTLNGSYWVFPALEDFDKHFPSPAWQHLIQSGAYVTQTGFGDVNLPLDWVDIKATGDLDFSEKFDPVYGFNAVRIPLHQAWSSQSIQREQLEPYLHFWTAYEPPVAWINVKTAETADYAWSTGMQAIAKFAQARAAGIPIDTQALPRPSDEEGYFSWSLVLLTHIAIQETQ